MIQRILVALDDSARAPRVLASAAEIAERFEAVLVPFRAVAIPPEFPPAAHLSHADGLATYLDDEARAQLTSLLAGLTVRHEPPVVGHGTPPWRAILHAAREQNVHLIVMGSHGYHGLDRVLGTTAAHVADLARLNVLVVHDDGEGPNGDATPPRDVP